MKGEGESGVFGGKRVLVTGGTRGIGRALCLAFGAEGAKVAFVYHKREDLARSLAEEMGGAAIQADLRCAQAAGAAAERAAQALGGLDIVVNNAGYLEKCDLADMTEELYYDILNTSLTSAYFVSQRALRHMGEGGAILNITSQAAFTGSAGGSAYAAAKAGLLGLTYSLAKELGPRGIRVNCLAPGRIETEMIAYGTPQQRAKWLEGIPLGRFGQSEDIAQAALFLCSEHAAYITGACLNVNGGMLMG